MSAKLYDSFELEVIEKLADIVNAKELSEITVTDGDKSITIKGKKCPPPPPQMPMPQMGMPMPNMAVPTPPVAGDNSGNAPKAAGGKQVKAPIVGTFYAAPSPDSKPYVSVGDTVKKGDIIFIIESMKVMSEVQSEFDGVVKEIIAKNGDAVEYDQTVMILE